MRNPADCATLWHNPPHCGIIRRIVRTPRSCPARFARLGNRRYNGLYLAVDKILKCGKMILYIVYTIRAGTRGRVRLSSGRVGQAGRPGKTRRGAGLLLACCLLALGALLAACDGGGQARPTPSEPEGEPAGAVSTVAMQSTTQAPSAVPTATPTPTITPTPTPPAPLAAQVNGQYIFLTDYERRVAQYEQALADQGQDPALAREEVLEGLIDRALIQQGAAALGIQIGDEALDRQVEADIAAGGGKAAFAEWLQAP
ncbi:MAG: hypothetical protein EHM56_12735, partial [Chloroflexi bacterium]